MSEGFTEGLVSWFYRVASRFFLWPNENIRLWNGAKRHEFYIFSFRWVKKISIGWMFHQPVWGPIRVSTITSGAKRIEGEITLTVVEFINQGSWKIRNRFTFPNSLSCFLYYDFSGMEDAFPSKRTRGRLSFKNRDVWEVFSLENSQNMIK